MTVLHTTSWDIFTVGDWRAGLPIGVKHQLQPLSQRPIRCWQRAALCSKASYWTSHRSIIRTAAVSLPHPDRGAGYTPGAGPVTIVTAHCHYMKRELCCTTGQESGRPFFFFTERPHWTTKKYKGCSPCWIARDYKGPDRDDPRFPVAPLLEGVGCSPCTVLQKSAPMQCDAPRGGSRYHMHYAPMVGPSLISDVLIEFRM